MTDASRPPPISRLPDELLEAIVSHLPPTATLSFGTTSRRNNKFTYEPLVWRRHCTEIWRYWEPHHELEEKLHSPPTQTKWRQLYNERTQVDRKALELFDQMLLTQQYRFERMEKIAGYGYDVKDLLLTLRNETPEDANDVLARKYHANAILGQIHRATALEKWMRLQNRQMVRLEEVLGAYDLFVLSGAKGDLNDVDKELDRLAKCIKDRDPEFEELSIRKKAQQTAKYLRSEGLVGNPNVDDYHALRNNFISMALFDEVHSSLPLQSVAIYCAVARRLGVNAKPSNYPQHVHAVIEAPAEVTLDGKARTPTPDMELDTMHMDPWRSSDEMPPADLRTRLSQMGAPPQHHASYLGPASTLEIALRTGRNIMTSVQEARERQRGITRRSTYPDIEAAWYSMLWSMLVLGDAHGAATLHRRRQCLPYLVEHFQAHFPEDIGLVEKHIPAMFADEREYNILLHLITQARSKDRNLPAPRPRDQSTKEIVKYKIGDHFTHRRYGYEGVIVGWNIRCDAEPRWIEQMGVDDLPRGREQPFYNAVYDSPPLGNQRAFYTTVCVHADFNRADDKSVRYVAEENIGKTEKGDDMRPCAALMALAGRYFKRWDDVEKRFVSNLEQEYPDD
ncbi:F-box only 21 [Lecanosticta acicola]|uniref:F-box only 21 n=1 Tax=Lecanosticta acicola TaxID=111012 RepID=A0AAI9E9X3_9PEZI|nr:F-box only 21 [Lecanosticta acicola]